MFSRPFNECYSARAAPSEPIQFEEPEPEPDPEPEPEPAPLRPPPANLHSQMSSAVRKIEGAFGIHEGSSEETFNMEFDKEGGAKALPPGSTVTHGLESSLM
eukprot:scaffold427200_cov17-Prasinocladus_malaysianus.AAC.1